MVSCVELAGLIPGNYDQHAGVPREAATLCGIEVTTTHTRLPRFPPTLGWSCLICLDRS
jgi:hypothetical protein